MKISNITTGFLEIPNQISINIFSQGCSIRCPNCHNKELWDFDKGIELSQFEFLKIINSKMMANWICWLGGEPTDQNDFREFLQIPHKLKQCLYTGKSFDSLSDCIKNYCDLIISEPFIEYPVMDIRSNQEIWFKNQKNIHEKISWIELQEQNIVSTS